MIEQLVPPAVVSVETDAELLKTALSADEEEALGQAVEKRRREYVTGRACAHLALRRLGFDSTSIGTGERGKPLWPDGVVGSITHCSRLRACAVARAVDVLSLGIDAEVNEPLPGGVFKRIASRVERRGAFRASPDTCLDRLLFSAKEAVFKAWYPLTARWLWFQDVEVSVDPSDATFHARLLVAAPRELEQLHGRWAVAGDVVATAVVVPRAFAAAGPSPLLDGPRR